MATDGGGNTDTCRFTVTVNDTSGPVVNCPADQNHYYDQNCEFTIIDFSSLLSTTDNCDNSPTLIQSPAVGSLVSSDTVISFLSTDDQEIQVHVHLIYFLQILYLLKFHVLRIKMIFIIQIVSLHS